MSRGARRHRGGSRSLTRARPSGRARQRAERAWAEGVTAHRAGDLAGALVRYREALSEDPGHAGAALNGALAARALGQPELAESLVRDALRGRPREVSLLSLLGNLCYERGDVEEAERSYRAALALSPADHQLRFNLARALRRLGRTGDAIELLEGLRSEAPQDPGVWSALGAARLDAGDPEGALADLGRALALDPRHPEALVELGLAHIETGSFEAAADALRRAIEAAPASGAPYSHYVKTRRFGPADEPELRRFEARLRDPRLGPSDRADLHFALGKMLDDMGRPAEAFGHFRAGNELARALLPFDPAARAAQTKAIIETFSGPWLAERRRRLPPEARARGEGLVFIVGMPRSGTTLVEQIIAAHPEAFGAGEVLAVPELGERLSAEGGGDVFPEGLEHLPDEAFARAARSYLERLPEDARTARVVTDKLPLNYRYVGLIECLFPAARVVHVRRDPMDVGLSLYFRRFTQGHAWAYDLESIARELRDCERLMGHWKQVSALPLLELDYERAVDDLEGSARALIAHCGLPWDPVCLRFHTVRRPVHTASAWQVRQPLYRSSVARWRRYESELEPLRRALEGGP